MVGATHTKCPVRLDASHTTITVADAGFHVVDDEIRQELLQPNHGKCGIMLLNQHTSNQLERDGDFIKRKVLQIITV